MKGKTFLKETKIRFYSDEWLIDPTLIKHPLNFVFFKDMKGKSFLKETKITFFENVEKDLFG